MNYDSTTPEMKTCCIRLKGERGHGGVGGAVGSVITTEVSHLISMSLCELCMFIHMASLPFYSLPTLSNLILISLRSSWKWEYKTK